MRIGQYPLRARETVEQGIAAKAEATVPADANIIHLGAQPDGRIYIWAEVPEIITNHTSDLELILLVAGAPVPEGYKFRGAIQAEPMLFVYQRVPSGPIPSTSSIILPQGEG
jgi:hypothetical protein